MFRRKRCLHTHLRCLHGEAVHMTMKGFFVSNCAVVRCNDCGKALYDRVRPLICTETNKPHGIAEMVSWLRWKDE